MSSLFDNVNKTLTTTVGSILIILGTISTSIGIYAAVKTKDEPFYDVFIRDAFESDQAWMYMTELRLFSTPFIGNADLQESYKAFHDAFGSKVMQKLLVEHAFTFTMGEEGGQQGNKKQQKGGAKRGRRRAPAKNNKNQKKKEGEGEEEGEGSPAKDNLKLSYFMEGFIDFTKEGEAKQRSSAHWVGKYVKKRAQDAIDGIGEKFGISDASSFFTGEDTEEERRRSVDVPALRRIASSAEVNEARERRRSEDKEDADSEENGMFARAMLAVEDTFLGRSEYYNAGIDTAAAVNTFALNYIVCVVFGVFLLIMGILSFYALSNKWISFGLGFAVYLIGFFCLFQYGQSQGWGGMEGLTKGNFGGVSIEYEEGLRDNELADKVISALMGFYKPYYLIIAFVLFLIIGTTFMKLAFFRNSCMPATKSDKITEAEGETTMTV